MAITAQQAFERVREMARGYYVDIPNEDRELMERHAFSVSLRDMQHENVYSYGARLFKESSPDHLIHDIFVIEDLLLNELKIGILAREKTPEEKQGECMEFKISQLGLQEAPKQILNLKPGQCPECKLIVAGWKSMFGSFAPEWWASMREKGINPATGHLSNCNQQ